MKIKVNPFAVSDGEAVSLLVSNLNDVQKMFTRIKAALSGQKEILGRMDPALNKKRLTDGELSQLADELDRIVLNCKEGDFIPFEGRAGMYNPTLSIWIISGIHNNERERIYIRTMTAAGLGIRSGGGINSGPEQIQAAREKIDKEQANIDAYASRFGHTADTWKNRVPASYSKVPLMLEVKNGQVDFVKTAAQQISVMYAILKRLKELALLSAGKNFIQNRNVEVEVSALVDEIDRIASQTSFNRFRLLSGEFSEKSRYASLWFLAGDKMEKSERVFLRTITAYALGLNDNRYCARRISDNHDVFNSSVDRSIKILEDEIKRLQILSARLDKLDDKFLNESGIRNVLDRVKDQ